MVCPKCGSESIQTQTFQEEQGSKTVTKYRFKARSKKHGFLWWVFIGWWWWMVDLMLWILFFPFKFIYSLFFKRKKYDISGRSIARTKNKIKYKTVYVCQDCGNRWIK